MNLTLNTIQNGLLHPFKIYILFLGGGSFWPGLCIIFLGSHLSESDPEKIWALGEVTPWFFIWGFERTIHCRHQKKPGRLVQWHCDCLFWESQTTKYHKTPTQYGPLLQWHWNYYFLEFQTTEHHFSIYLKSIRLLSMGWMKFFSVMSKILSSRDFFS